MNAERPKIKIPFQTVDVVFELASIAVLILMWIHLSIEFSALPETVPSHFNAAGEPNNFSQKGFLWFLPILATGMYIGLFFLNRFPHLHNYMVNITEENAFKQYTFSTKMLRIINFLCTLMFAYINYKIIVGAKNNASDLGIGFLITVVSISIILPIVIYISQKKMNK